MKIGIFSLYANPLHGGHIDVMDAAKIELKCDNLIAIVNNDYQVRLKGSIPFMDEKSRLRIIVSLKPVDLGMIAVDQDPTVVESLKHIRGELPNDELLFLNGGDRGATNTPESEYCASAGIACVYNVGGGKSNHSSKLIENAIIASRKKTTKPWGEYTDLYRDNNTVFKEIVVHPGQKLSLQYHYKREEFWYVLSGYGIANTGSGQKFVRPGDSLHIKVGEIHNVGNPTNEPLIIREMQCGVCEEEDIVRLEDIYGRK